MAELNEQIMEFMQKKSESAKKKFYMADIVKAMVDEGYKKREVQKAVNALITEDKLMYWSSGSTTMIMLPEFFKENT